MADTFFNTGVPTNAPTGYKVLGTTLQNVFTTQRFDPFAAPEMTYTLPVVPGKYRLNLLFADIYDGTTTVGSRVFNVAIQGVAQLTNFDIVKQVGWGAAFISSKTITVTGTSIVISFTHTPIENPGINGIELLGRAPLPSNTISTISSAITTSSVAGVTTTTTKVGVTTTTTTTTKKAAVTTTTTTTKAAVTTTTTTTVKTGTVLFRINSGGRAFTDSAGNQWISDSYFAGGLMGAAPTGAVVSGTTDQILYTTYRYAPSYLPQLLSYSIPLPAAGTYVVTLFFAQTDSQFTAVGATVFSILIEGVRVAASYDPIADVGYLAAGKRQFTVTSDTLLNIDLAPISVLGYPILCGIQVASTSTSGGSVTTTTTTKAVVTTTTTTTKAAVISTTTTTTKAVVTTTTTTTVSSAGTVVYLLNCGGPAFVDSKGRQWSADTGVFVNTGDVGITTDVVIIGAPAADQILYQSERYRFEGAGIPATMLWTFPVTPGTFRVVLHFAEVFWYDPGYRMFNIIINNVLVLANFDIVAQVGFVTATTRTFTTTVTGTQLLVNLVPLDGYDNPKISGIEIIRV